MTHVTLRLNLSTSPNKQANCFHTEQHSSTILLQWITAIYLSDSFQFYICHKIT